MKIIHLSDTHVGRDNNTHRLQALLDDIRTLGNPADHVLIHTGDLNDHGTKADMALSLPLLDAMRAEGWRVLLAPGNHDCGNALKVDPVCAALFMQQYEHHLFGTSAPEFPVLTLLPNCAFIGLDSNEAEMGFWQRLAAEGHLGQRQIKALNAMLDLPEVRDRCVVLYLHHHPFQDAYAVRADAGDGHTFAHWLGWKTRGFRRLKDAYSLLQCVRDRAHILLFGHQHFGLDYSADGQRYGISLALDGSSSTAAQMDTDRMRYRVIDTHTRSYVTRCVRFPSSG